MNHAQITQNLLEIVNQLCESPCESTLIYMSCSDRRVVWLELLAGYVVWEVNGVLCWWMEVLDHIIR